MSTRTAVWVRSFGGPDVLRVEESEVPAPGPGQVLVRVADTAVNFLDVNQRAGRSRHATLPYIPGHEAAGVVEEVGAAVTEVRAGDRVVWVNDKNDQGTYTTHALALAAEVVPVPEGIDMATAAAVPMQGLMAHGLTSVAHPIRPNDVVLVQAAASGIGGLLCQVAKVRGARVIGTVSTRVKADHARTRGADEVIVRSEVDDVGAAVRRATAGRGVDVAYDGVGAATFQSSLDALRPHGALVIYGAASGPHPLVDTTWLSARGGVYVTRAVLGHFLPDRAALLARMAELFDWIRTGRVGVDVSRSYTLREASRAHAEIESGAHVGKILLEVA